jgi:hypothetical protein
MRYDGSFPSRSVVCFFPPGYYLLLAAIALDDIRRVTHFARMQEALFIQHINQRNSAEARREMERLQRELDAMRRRDTELSTLFRRLYEDNVLGRITNEQEFFFIKERFRKPVYGWYGFFYLRRIYSPLMK